MGDLVSKFNSKRMLLIYAIKVWVFYTMSVCVWVLIDDACEKNEIVEKCTDVKVT